MGQTTEEGNRWKDNYVRGCPLSSVIRPLSFRHLSPESPLAFDRDEIDATDGAAGRVTGRSAPGDLVRLGLAERHRLAVSARLAVGACHRLAAIGPAGQALIDAVTVGLVFHNEDPGFGAGRERQSGKDGDR